MARVEDPVQARADQRSRQIEQTERDLEISKETVAILRKYMTQEQLAAADAEIRSAIP